MLLGDQQQPAELVWQRHQTLREISNPGGPGYRIPDSEEHDEPADVT